MDWQTNSILLNLLLFAVGVAVLVKGSDWFVDAAVALARKMGVSELIIGLTLVSVGTSLPELASSLCAAYYGEAAFIMGNIVGSNIANIALILGAGLVLGGAMEFSREVVRRDLLFLWGVGLLLWGWFTLGFEVDKPYGVSWIAGVILLLGGVLYTAKLCKDNAIETEEDSNDGEALMSAGKAVTLLIAALVMITAGAKLMVDTAVGTAAKLGVDSLVISLTIVAIGTSLPELAVTISGVLKKRDDIALGNIVGSCIYNILLIIGCCAVVTPLAAVSFNSSLAMIMMNCVILLLLAFAGLGKKLYRWQGVVFLMIYAAFSVWSVFFCR